MSFAYATGSLDAPRAPSENPNARRKGRRPPMRCPGTSSSRCHNGTRTNQPSSSHLTSPPWWCNGFGSPNSIGSATSTTPPPSQSARTEPGPPPVTASRLPGKAATSSTKRPCSGVRSASRGCPSALNRTTRRLPESTRTTEPSCSTSIARTFSSSPGPSPFFPQDHNRLPSAPIRYAAWFVLSKKTSPRRRLDGASPESQATCPTGRPLPKACRTPRTTEPAQRRRKTKTAPAPRADVPAGRRTRRRNPARKASPAAKPSLGLQRFENFCQRMPAERFHLHDRSRRVDDQSKRRLRMAQNRQGQCCPRRQCPMRERFAGQPDRNIHRTTLQDDALHDYALLLKGRRRELHWSRRLGAVFGIPNENHAAPRSSHGHPQLRKLGPPCRFTDLGNQQQAAAENQGACRQQTKTTQPGRGPSLVHVSSACPHVRSPPAETPDRRATSSRRRGPDGPEPPAGPPSAPTPPTNAVPCAGPERRRSARSAGGPRRWRSTPRDTEHPRRPSPCRAAPRPAPTCCTETEYPLPAP